MVIEIVDDQELYCHDCKRATNTECVAMGHQREMKGQEARDLVATARDLVMELGQERKSAFCKAITHKAVEHRAQITINALCDEVERLRSDQWNAARVIQWMDDPRRAPAIHAFTAGDERQIAYRFERPTQELKDIAECDKCDLCEDHHR